MTRQFYSNGKLLLTGEYAVLDGALSWALPTKYGQTLTINEVDSPLLYWTSLDEKGEKWFHASLHLDLFRNPEVEVSNVLENLRASEDKVSEMLVRILLEAKRLNPDFLMEEIGYEVQTTLSFPREWGLGERTFFE